MIGPISQTIAQRQTRNRPIAVFNPLPWQIAPWRDTSPIILLTGSAGGGKSRLAAEKLHAYCLRYPGATALMARKVKASMAAGTVLFLRRKVVGRDPRVQFIDTPKLRFEYANGSILSFIGLQDEDARENLKSIGQDGSVDIAAMEEATQFDEEDFNAIIARMRGKAASWRQLILPTNPEAPTHWIKNRLIDGGQATVYYSSAKDNFHNPKDYQDWLATLTGVDYQRLVLGQWVQASGLVFGEVWNDAESVTPLAEYEEGAGDILWLVDDGYAGEADSVTGHFKATAHPRAILLVQCKPDGHLDVFYESYALETLSNIHIADVLALEYPMPSYAIRGPGTKEIQGQLFAQGIYSRQVNVDVEETIKEARKLLAADKNGVRRIRVHPRCRHLRSEMLSYRYDPVSGKVVKQFDHGPDCLRYLSWDKRHG